MKLTFQIMGRFLHAHFDNAIFAVIKKWNLPYLFGIFRKGRPDQDIQRNAKAER